MSIPTVAVTCIAYDQNGNPVANGSFRARLNSTEIYNGFVVPEQVTGFADANGVCVLQLWPNALGVAGSAYRVTAINPDNGKKYLDANAVVPNSACNLHEIIVAAPYPEIDASEQALITAQGALALVTAQASIATTAATESESYATTAQTSATTASNAATTASNAATTASTKATEATASASSASASATSAASNASSASVSAADASSSAVDAQTYAGQALSSATAASASASSATTSASAASSSSAVALASANAASTSASTAATQASNAAVSASAAASSASSASNSMTNAAASESAALTWRNQAQTAATAADLSADAAENSRSLAEIAATNSASSATASAASATNSANSATASANSATASAGSATAAQGYLAPATGNSTTSLTVATGSQTLTIETGRAFVVGHPVKITSTANIANNMIGTVTAYNSATGSMTVDVSTIAGSGTVASWTVAITSVSSDGGIAGFDGVINTTSPNNTVNVSVLTATAGSTNADVAIIPKGTGAVLVDVPDNTTTGGNKRGTSAVDLQHVRRDAGQVAGANYSTIVGGRNNRISSGATDAAVVGGHTGYMYAPNSTAVGGGFAIGHQEGLTVFPMGLREQEFASSETNLRGQQSGTITLFRQTSTAGVSSFMVANDDPALTTSFRLKHPDGVSYDLTGYGVFDGIVIGAAFYFDGSTFSENYRAWRVSGLFLPYSMTPVTGTATLLHSVGPYASSLNAPTFNQTNSGTTNSGFNINVSHSSPLNSAQWLARLDVVEKIYQGAVSPPMFP